MFMDMDGDMGKIQLIVAYQADALPRVTVNM
jgi:hypothetical protein